MAREARFQVADFVSSLRKTAEPADPAALEQLLTRLPAQSPTPGEFAGQWAGRIVAGYRELADAHPDTYRPDLAWSLTGLATLQDSLGLGEAAVAATEEAITIYRELADVHPDSYRPYLAWSLTRLAAELNTLARREAALAATEEAVTVYRELADVHPDSYRPYLALTLTRLDFELSSSHRTDAALAAREEAVAIYRELAAARPDTYRPDLAWSLTALSKRLHNLGRYEASLAAAEESVAIHRELAAAFPDAFRDKLATSVSCNLAAALRELGIALAATSRHEDALDAHDEARMLEEFGSSRGDDRAPAARTQRRSSASRRTVAGMKIDKDEIERYVNASPDWPCSLGVVLRIESASRRDVATVRDAIPDDIDDWPWDELQLYSVEDSPFGPTLFVEYEGMFPQIEDFLDTLAAKLVAAGLRGRMTLAHTQRPPVSWLHVKQPGFVAALFATAHAGTVHAPRSVVDHALQWCQVPGGKFYVSFGFGDYLVGPESRGQLLAKALRSAEPGRVGITCFTTTEQARQVSFSDEGVVYQETYPGVAEPDGWRVGLAKMTKVLEELAPEMDYGFVRRLGFGDCSHHRMVSEWPENPHLRPGNARHARNRSHVAVPDAFGVMVLSPSHNWTPPSTDWTTRPLAGDRTLLTYKDSDALFAGTRPDEATVHRMREDMKSILMTDDMATIDRMP